MNKSTTPKLSITREPDGDMIEIVGHPHKLLELYGFLSQVLIREQHIPRKLLEAYVTTAGDLWDASVSGLIVCDKGAILE